MSVMDYENEHVVVMQSEGVTVVRFRDEHLGGVGEIERLGEEIEKLLAAGVRKLVLDFKQVRYFTSSALGMLIATHKMMAELGGGLVLSNPQAVRELLVVSRTDRLFKLAENAREAVKMLR